MIDAAAPSRTVLAMTTNEPAQEPIAAYQVLVNDWVLIAPNPASREQWHKVVEISHHPEGLGTDLVVIRATGPTRMALQNVLYAMRSETMPTDPPGLDDQAREILTRNYPGVRFRITRRAGGLTLSWADAQHHRKWPGVCIASWLLGWFAGAAPYQCSSER